LRVINKNLPPDTPVQAVNNLLVGPGVFWLGASWPLRWQPARHAAAHAA
jgi:hypothetical protein